MGKISVIVPIFNADAYLNRCIESIVKQTYSNIEIILVDDGSNDNSGAICDSWAQDDDRIRVIHQNNAGISEARNAGLMIATGDYIGFVDSDDYLEPRMYESLLNGMIESGTSVSMCAYKAVDEYGMECRRIYADLPDSIVTQEEYLETIYLNERTRCSLVVVWNKLYKRDIIDGLCFRNVPTHEDELWTNDVVARTEKVCILGTSYYNYVQRESSTIHTKTFLGDYYLYQANVDRLNIGIGRDISERVINVISKECIDIGIVAWVRATKSRMIDNTDLSLLKNEVKGLISIYGKRCSMKDKVKYLLFYYAPQLYKNIYFVVKE